MTTETAHESHNAHEDGEHHVDSLQLYFGVFGALIVLTVVTVGASYVDVGAANTPIAVIIASMKAALVAFFFMHLRHDKPFHALVFVAGLFFLSFLFLFTLTDEGSRGDVDGVNGSLVEKPADSAAPVGAGSPSGAAGVATAQPPHH